MSIAPGPKYLRYLEALVRDAFLPLGSIHFFRAARQIDAIVASFLHRLKYLVGILENAVTDPDKRVGYEGIFEGHGNTPV